MWCHVSTTPLPEWCAQSWLGGEKINAIIVTRDKNQNKVCEANWWKGLNWAKGNF